MKKIRDRKKYKRHQLARGRHELKRGKKHGHGAEGISRPWSGKETKEEVICAPKILSFMNEQTQTLRFFSEIESLLKKGKRIYVDFADCETVDVEILAYLLARIGYYEARNMRIRIRGNLPKSNPARASFHHSAFLDFVSTPLATRTVPDSNVFAICSGIDVDPGIAQKAQEFAKSKVSNLDPDSARALYHAIIELMGNTNEHAYIKPRKYNSAKRWWLLGYQKEGSNRVQFIFLDDGLGIPKTMKLKLFESIKSDGSLIQSALKGDLLRSRTGLTYRGEGLPTINNACMSGEISEVRVLALKGSVQLPIQKIDTLERSLQGTLVHLTIGRQERK